MYGNLEEEVCMDLPPSFEDGTKDRKVCKLKKSLYGLKQSPRVWFEKFFKILKVGGYLQSQGDFTLFFNNSPLMKITMLIAFVDNIIENVLKG